MTLSETLKRLRKLRGIPQSQIAEAAGISTTQYQNYEYGKSEPTATVLIALADFFNVSTDYLLGETDNPTRLSVKAIVTKNHVFVEGTSEYRTAGIVEKMYAAEDAVVFFNALSAKDQRLVLDFMRLLEDYPKS